jgi:hypothetical protein
MISIFDELLQPNLNNETNLGIIDHISSNAFKDMPLNTAITLSKNYGVEVDPRLINLNTLDNIADTGSGINPMLIMALLSDGLLSGGQNQMITPQQTIYGKPPEIINPYDDDRRLI